MYRCTQAIVAFCLACALHGICGNQLHAQSSDTVFLRISSTAPIEIKPLPFETFLFRDAISAQGALNDILRTWYADGYLLAAYTMHTSGDTIFAAFTPGPRIAWAQIHISEQDMPIAQLTGLYREWQSGDVFSYTQLADICTGMVTALNDRGYPFAAVSFTDWQLRNDSVTATLHIERNRFFTFDSILVIGNLDISTNYMQQFTGIIPGKPYDQSIIDALPERLKTLAFANIVRDPMIEFIGDQARILVYAEARKTSRFDFILGVLPDNAITGRLVITGDLQLQLQNTFHQGETMQLQYTKLESSTKSLLAKVAYPYLPTLPIGPEAMFYLYLKDSTFLERKTDAGLVYQLSGNDRLKALVHFNNSTVLRPDTVFALANFALPDMLDVQERTYGLEWQMQKLNDVFNPRAGWWWNISASAGTRTIQENASITGLFDPENPEYDFASLYDSIDVKTFSGNYRADLQRYFPLFDQSTLLIQYRGAGLLQPDPVANELMRIGGSNLLRGFDEQSLPVASYHLGTAEYRYLLGPRSFASLFVDAGYVMNPTAIRQEMWVYGFGAGIRFESKAGIFGLTYALGGTSEAPVQFRNTKVHFGYINYF